MIRKLITGIFLGTAAMSFGQFGEMPQMDYMPALFLNPAVAKDMHLSQEVVSKEQSVLIQEGMAMMPLISQNGSGADKAKLAKEMLKGYEKMSKDSLAYLTPAQKARYKQLSLQFFGPVALAQPKNEAAIGLTSTQKMKVMSMLGTTSQAMTGSFKKMQKGGGNMAGAFGAMTGQQEQVRAAQDKALKSILTPGQMAKWNALQGKKLPGITNLLSGMGGGMGAGMGM